MSFKIVNGSFGFVAAVHVGWDELECAFVGFFDGKFVGCAGFVVQACCLTLMLRDLRRAMILLYAGMR